MRFVRTAIIAGVASAALAGAALAARDDSKLMLIALPDGSVQHIRYTGNVAPRIVFVPVATAVSPIDAVFGPGSIFAEMDRMSEAMEARAAAMMRQASTMPARDGQGIVMTNAQGQPVGMIHYSYVSSSTDPAGCTRTVSYSSQDTARADQPRVIRTSSGSCGGDPAPLSSKASAATPSAAPQIDKKPAPKIIPVSAPKPENIFTPSRT